MAIVRNLVANSTNQGVSFLANIIAVPLYLTHLGTEQYGLLGFTIVVQTWINLLEAGMSGTLGREMTRLLIGDASEGSVHSFLRSLDWLFLGAILILPSIGWLSRGWWASSWFVNETLDPRLIGQCMVLIIALAPVRLAAMLYKGGLMGAERQVFVSAVSIVGSVVRLALPLPFIWAVPDVRIVVAAWLGVSLVELVVVRLELSRIFSTRLAWMHFSLAELRDRAYLWGRIAYLAVAWAAITQTDKLILSRILPLADYGRFTLVMIVSNAILAIPAPICFAFQPRMTAAAARGDRRELAQLVHDLTRIMMVLMVAPAFALAAVPYLAMLAWTGDAAAAQATSRYLGPNVLGSGLVSFAIIVYLIQYAYGDLKLHVRAYTAFAVVLIPAEIVVASRFGAVGAAWLWLAVNAAFLLAYYPLVFHRFLPGEAKRWYGLVVAPPAVAAAAVAWAIASSLDMRTTNRVTAMLETGAMMLAACAAAGVTTLAIALWKRRRPAAFALHSTPESEVRR
jgi:O-antigen/teichoic acid export membrane protein